MPNLSAHASFGSEPPQPAPGALRVGERSWGLQESQDPLRTARLSLILLAPTSVLGPPCCPPMPYISGVSPIWEASTPEALPGFFQES